MGKCSRNTFRFIEHFRKLLFQDNKHRLLEISKKIETLTNKFWLDNKLLYIYIFKRILLELTLLPVVRESTKTMVPSIFLFDMEVSSGVLSS